MSVAYIPLRIVSLQPSATSILHAVGAADLIVGCTKYCIDILPELSERNLTIVSDSWTADASQIRALKPDFVLASVPYQEKAVSEILKAGVRFMGTAPRTLEDIYMDIAATAGIVGRKEQGLAVVRTMQDEIRSVWERVRGLPKPRVYCEEWGKPLIASQPWVMELVEAAGGEFCIEPGSHTDAEAVAGANPDVIVAAWCGAGDRVPLEKIVRDRNWKNLGAAKERRVYCVRDEYLNTPGPTLIRGLKALAAAIHPEAIGEADGLRRIAAG